MTTHWLEWYRDYDDPQSSLSRRLRVVRLSSLCAGDGRDVLPVLAASGVADRTRALLVELELERRRLRRAGPAAADGRDRAHRRPVIRSCLRCGERAVKVGT